MVGAMRPDTEELEHKVNKDLPAISEALDRAAQGASFCTGHNIIGHDLPYFESKLRIWHYTSYR